MQEFILLAGSLICQVGILVLALRFKKHCDHETAWSKRSSLPAEDIFPTIGSEDGLIYFRSQKSDGPFEGSAFIEKVPEVTWMNAVIQTKQRIEKEHDAKSPVMITYFTKL